MTEGAFDDGEGQPLDSIARQLELLEIRKCMYELSRQSCRVSL